MSNISDEMLMAYADGELPEAEVQRVRAYLASSPEGASRLNAFTRTGRDLGLLYDQPMHEAIPKRLLDAVRGPSLQNVGVPSDRSTPKVSYAALLVAMLFPQAAPWSAGAAAVAILAIGGIGGWSLHGAKSDATATTSIASAVDGALLANRDFSRVLDATSGGQIATIGRDAAKVSVKPLLTFQSLAGNYCRQYEMSTDADARFMGVGCRLQAGQWQIEVHAPVAGGPTTTPGGFAPASGRSSPTVEGAIDRMIKGDVFSQKAERALIENQWQLAP